LFARSKLRYAEVEGQPEDCLAVGDRVGVAEISFLTRVLQGEIMKLSQMLAKTGKQLGILVTLIAGLIAVFYFTSHLLLGAARDSLTSHPSPVANYAEAVARFEKVQSSEEPTANPLARSILLTHGNRTEKVIVFFHGYSSSPQQFRQLGERFFQLGYNVLIPLLPHHGMADRKLENLSRLRAEELRDCADTSVDIAAGLGDRVCVCGLSAGGAMAAWIAENRKEVSRALLIAPALVLGRRAGTFLDRIAVFFIAWVPAIPADLFSPNPDAPQYAYPGFSAKALGQLLRMTFATFADALQKPPAVQDIFLVTTKTDHTVSDFAIWQLIGLWRGKGLRHFVSVDFPKEMRIPHDMIDPAHRSQKTEVVHPILIGLVNAP
jgi:pimeloyl-ACP methyl ester carboxylesterase